MSLAPCVVGVEVVAAVFLRRAEPVEEFGLLGIGETFAVEVACDQSVDMSVLCVHLSYSRIGGPNPYLPDRKKIPIRPKRSGKPQHLPSPSFRMCPVRYRWIRTANPPAEAILTVGILSAIVESITESNDL